MCVMNFGLCVMKFFLCVITVIPQFFPFQYLHLVNFYYQNATYLESVTKNAFLTFVNDYWRF
jgi:hypothetical protein